MTPLTATRAVEKLKTEIPGFDEIAGGGLPKGRTTLVVGATGTAKTVFAAQFLAEGVIRAGQSGVFVTFEENPEDIRRNMLSFGWDIAKWESEGKWAFVDGSPSREQEFTEVGRYDLKALTARIENGIKKTGAQRVCLDALGVVLNQFNDSGTVRRELARTVEVLKKIDVTAIITAEGLPDRLSRHGVEAFVADNVIVLRNVLQEEKRRMMEVLKFRGTSHRRGEYPFTVMPGRGIVVIPVSPIELEQKSSGDRISSGNVELDKMCGGGPYRGSIILTSGATGTGKTLVATEFVTGGVTSGDRCLLFSFEESREQLFRNAAGWGGDFKKAEDEGLLKAVCACPEANGVEEHFLRMKAEIESFRPSRIVVDSLSAIERTSTVKGFGDFVVGLASLIKRTEISGFLTMATADLLGSASFPEASISKIADAIILLRYVEMFGEIRRGITVLKMRGSAHDKDIRQITIDAEGMHIGQPFRNVIGILSGNVVHVPPGEMERLGEMFKEEAAVHA